MTKEYLDSAQKIFTEVKTNPDYAFLHENEHLKGHLLMVGLGGSYAYGTQTESSDIDIRGIALNSREEILLGRDFEQVISHHTDTTIYSLKKMVQLLTNNNPNCLEILGLKKEQLLLSSDIYQMLVDNTDLFLSKLCVYSFGGYANQQLRRLETKSARSLGQSKKEEYILGSIQSAEYVFRSRFAQMDADSLKLYLDDSKKEGMEKEIYLDVSLSHYPLRDFSSLIAEYRQIVTGYDRLGRRNKNAIEHSKLAKHMMHLFRLYHMAFEILEDGIICTFRESDHDFLMEVRNGCFLTEDEDIVPEFYEIVEEYDEKLNHLAKTSSLREKPDYEGIDKLLMEIHTKVLDEK